MTSTTGLEGRTQTLRLLGVMGYTLQAVFGTYLVASFIGQGTGPYFLPFVWGPVAVLVSLTWLLAGEHGQRRLFTVRGIAGLVAFALAMVGWLAHPFFHWDGLCHTYSRSVSRRGLAQSGGRSSTQPAFDSLTG